MLAAYVTLFLLAFTGLSSVGCLFAFAFSKSAHKPMYATFAVAFTILLIITNTVLFHFEPTIP